MAVLQLCEDLFRCDELPGFCLLRFVDNLQFAEQYISHLFGRCNVERLTGKCVYLLFNVGKALAKQGRGLLECTGIYPCTVALHVRKNGNKRHLNVVEKFLDALFCKFTLQYVLKFECDIGILASIVAYKCRGNIAHVLLVLPFLANQFLNLYCLVTKINLGKVVHPVVKFRLKKIVGYHGIEKFALYLNAVIG